MTNLIDATVRYLEEKWPGRFIINFFGYLVILVPIALGYAIVTKWMKLKPSENDRLWVRVDIGRSGLCTRALHRPVPSGKFD